MGAAGPSGPQGPSGPSGVSGYQKVSSTVTVSAGFIITQILNCPSGASIFGGGLSFDMTGLNPNDIAKITLVQSGPYSTSSWATVVTNLGSANPSGNFYAICAKAN
jgi:hypothetical protein